MRPSLDERVNETKVVANRVFTLRVEHIARI
jgi:hypothetical protein